jgi:hypothetical protein
MIRTKEEMYKAIRNWEIDEGESFLDYFESNLNEYNLLFWALGKGYINEKGFQEYELNYKNNCYTGDDIVYGNYSFSIIRQKDDKFWIGSEYEEAMLILAEFLSSSKTYQERVDMFLKNITIVNFDDALKFYRKNKKVFYEFEGEKTYLTAGTFLSADTILKAKWFIDNN